MKIIQANLLDLFDNCEFDVIAHGCNCHCTMNSGIAKTIKEKYPAAYNIDFYSKKGDIQKLGGYSWAYAEREKDYRKYTGKIYNLYTQYNYGNDGKQYVRYDAISLCLYKLNQKEKGKKIGLPKIGCGLGGADWNIVKKIIEDNCKDLDITVCYL